jgi:amyloid beta precursor protein binding protein 1
MVAMDEDNYKEAIEASFKVFAPRGISEYKVFRRMDLKFLENDIPVETCWLLIEVEHFCCAHLFIPHIR